MRWKIKEKPGDSGHGRGTKIFTGEAGGAKRPRDYGPRDYSDRPCAGGKPAAHPLHRYITYEKWRISTRYIPVTRRYTGAAQGGGGHANSYSRHRAGGKPVAHPLHRYITYEKRRISTRYIPVTCRYTGAAPRDHGTTATGLVPGGNRRNTRYTATLVDYQRLTTSFPIKKFVLRSDRPR
jgi:hypothetical protein